MSSEKEFRGHKGYHVAYANLNIFLHFLGLQNIPVRTAHNDFLQKKQGEKRETEYARHPKRRDARKSLMSF